MLGMDRSHMQADMEIQEIMRQNSEQAKIITALKRSCLEKDRRIELVQHRKRQRRWERSQEKMVGIRETFFGYDEDKASVISEASMSVSQDTSLEEDSWEDEFSREEFEQNYQRQQREHLELEKSYALLQADRGTHLDPHRETKLRSRLEADLYVAQCKIENLDNALRIKGQDKSWVAEKQKLEKANSQLGEAVRRIRSREQVLRHQLVEANDRIEQMEFRLLELENGQYWDELSQVNNVSQETPSVFDDLTELNVDLSPMSSKQRNGQAPTMTDGSAVTEDVRTLQQRLAEKHAQLEQIYQFLSDRDLLNQLQRHDASPGTDSVTISSITALDEDSGVGSLTSGNNKKNCKLKRITVDPSLVMESRIHDFEQECRDLTSQLETMKLAEKQMCDKLKLAEKTINSLESNELQLQDHLEHVKMKESQGRRHVNELQNSVQQLREQLDDKDLIEKALQEKVISLQSAEQDSMKRISQLESSEAAFRDCMTWHDQVEEDVPVLESMKEHMHELTEQNNDLTAKIEEFEESERMLKRNWRAAADEDARLANALEEKLLTLEHANRELRRKLKQSEADVDSACDGISLHEELSENEAPMDEGPSHGELDSRSKELHFRVQELQQQLSRVSDEKNTKIEVLQERVSVLQDNEIKLSESLAEMEEEEYQLRSKLALYETSAITVENMVKYEEKIHELRASESDLLDRMSSLEEHEENLTHTLDQTRYKHQREIDTLEKSLTEQQTIEDNLKKRISKLDTEKQHLEGKLTDFNSRVISPLRRENTDLKKEVLARTNSEGKAYEECDVLKKTVKEYERNENMMFDKFSSLESETVAPLQEEIDKLKIQNTELIEEQKALTQRISDLDTQKQEVAEKLHQAETVKSRMEDENFNLVSADNILKNKVSEMEENVKNREDTIAQMELKIAEMQILNGDIGIKASALEAEKDALEDENADLEDQLQSLEEASGTLKARMEEVEKHQLVVGEKLICLEHEKSVLQQDNRDSIAKVSQVENKNTVLNDRIADLEENIQSLENVILLLKSRIHDLEDKNTGLDTKVKSVESVNLVLEGERADLIAKVEDGEELEERKTELEENIENMRDVMEVMKIRINELEAKNEYLTSEMTTMRSQISALQSENNTLVSGMEDGDETKQNLQREISKMTEQQTHYKSRINDLEKQENELMEKVHQERERSDSLEDENFNLVSKISELEVQNESHSENISSKKLDMKELNSRNFRLSKENNSLNSRVMILETENKELTSKMSVEIRFLEVENNDLKSKLAAIESKKVLVSVKVGTDGIDASQFQDNDIEMEKDDYIGMLSAKVIDLETMNQNLLSDCEHFQQALNEQEEQESQMSMFLDAEQHLMDKIDELEHENADLEVEMTELKARCKILESGEQGAVLNELADQVAILQREKLMLMEQLENLGEGSTMQVPTGDQQGEIERWQKKADLMEQAEARLFERVTDLEENEQRLMSELNKVQVEASALEDLQEKLELVEEENHHLKETLEESKKRIEEHDEKVSYSEEEYLNMEKALTNQKDVLLEQMHEITKQEEEYKVQVQQLEKQIADFKTKESLSTGEISKLHQTCAGLRDEVASLQMKLNEMTTSQGACTVEKQNIEDCVIQLEKRERELEETVSQLKSKEMDLEQTNSRLHQSERELEEKLQKREKELGESGKLLQQTRSELEESLLLGRRADSDGKETVLRLETHTHSLEQELEATQDKLEELQTEYEDRLHATQTDLMKSQTNILRIDASSMTDPEQSGADEDSTESLHERIIQLEQCEEDLQKQINELRQREKDLCERLEEAYLQQRSTQRLSIQLSGNSDKANEEHQKLQRHVQQLGKNEGILQQRIAELESESLEKEKLLMKISKLETNEKKLKEENSNLLSSSQSSHSSVQAHISMLEKPEDVLQERIKELERLEKKLRKQIADVENDRDMLNTLARQDKAMLHEQKLQIEQLSLSETSLSEQARRAQDSERILLARVDDLRAELLDERERINSLQLQERRLAEILHRYRRGEQIHASNTQSLESSLADLLLSEEGHKQKLTIIEADRVTVIKNMSDLEQKLRHLEQAKRDTDEKSNEALSENMQLKNEVTRLQNSNLWYESQLHNLEHSNENVSDKLSVLLKEKDDLAMKCSEIQAQVTELECELKAGKDLISEITRDSDKVEHEKQSVQIQLHTSQLRLAELDAQVRQCAQTEKIMKDRISMLERTEKWLRAKVHELDQDRAKTPTIITSLMPGSDDEQSMRSKTPVNVVANLGSVLLAELQQLLEHIQALLNDIEQDKESLTIGQLAAVEGLHTRVISLQQIIQILQNSMLASGSALQGAESEVKPTDVAVGFKPIKQEEHAAIQQTNPALDHSTPTPDAKHSQVKNTGDLDLTSLWQQIEIPKPIPAASTTILDSEPQPRPRNTSQSRHISQSDGMKAKSKNKPNILAKPKTSEVAMAIVMSNESDTGTQKSRNDTDSTVRPSHSDRKVKSHRGHEKRRDHKGHRAEESQMVMVQLSASESSGSIAPPLPCSPPPRLTASRKVLPASGMCPDSADEVSDITEDEAMPCMTREQLPQPRILTTRHSTYVNHSAGTTAHTSQHQNVIDQYQQESKQMYRSPVERRRNRVKSSTDQEPIKTQAPIPHHEIKPPTIHPGYRSPDVRYATNIQPTSAHGSLSTEKKLPRYQRSVSNLEASRGPSVKDLIDRQRSRSPDDILPPTRYRKSSYRGGPDDQYSELQYLVEQKQHRYRKLSERNQVLSPDQHSQASDEIDRINSPQQERRHSKDSRHRVKSPADWAQKQAMDQARDTPDSRSTPVDYQVPQSPGHSEPDEELQEVKRSGIVGKLLMKIEKTTDQSSLSAFRPVSAPKPAPSNASQSNKRIKRPASADPLKQRSHLGNIYGGQDDWSGSNDKSVSRSTVTLNLVVPKRRAITPTSIQQGYQANGHCPPSPVNFMSAPGCPDSPSNFGIDRVVGNHALLLCWKPPPLDHLARSNGNQVLGYRILSNGQLCYQASSPHMNKSIIENMELSQSCVLSIQTVAIDGQVSPSVHTHFPGMRHRSQQRSSSQSDRHAVQMNFAEGEKRLFLAVYDYLPSQHSPQDFTGRELVLAEGDLVLVFGHARPDGFYYGEVNGQRGLVPASFVQEIPKSAQHTLNNNNYGH